jgi:SAM-dependent methyltransferase
LADDWHTRGANRTRIQTFAKSAGVDLIVSDRVPDILAQGSFDMVMVHDVIEHFTDSPREMLLKLIDLVASGGYLYVSVPNAVNLRKRLLVLFGRTNYPRFPAYYWSGSGWRGHKREYVKDDLLKMCHYLGLKNVLTRGEHHRLGALPEWTQGLYKMTLGQIDSFRETLALIGQKGPDWKPCEMATPLLWPILQQETPYRYKESETPC